jgi:biopolymer transport protein ExbB
MDQNLFIKIIEGIPTWAIIVPILLCSIILLAVFIERSLFYRKIDYDYRLITDKAAVLLKKKEFSEARLFCGGYSGPLVNMIENLISAAEAGKDIRADSEYYAGRAVRAVERYSALVATIATISPMLGLLGTVTGMMKSFSSMSGSAQRAHETLAYGITEALITTILGLIVAIPAVIIYNYMTARTAQFAEEIDNTAARLSAVQGKK